MVLAATDLSYITLTEAAGAFRTRELSPVELTRHLLDRSERLQATLCAFVTLTPEIALAQARAAEAAFLRGEHRSPVAGIPMGYKDIYFTQGVRTTAGSRLHEEFVPDFSATTVAKLEAAGAVMLGKLTTWEFAGGGADITQSYFPSARNPWDVTRSPYGSSSGSGTALAAGLVVGALGTDTGGSIRFPAAACGVAGLKPTYGRCSRWGVFPAAWSLDHTGPMARTVADCALLLNELAGYDPHDPASAREPVQDYTLGLNGGVRGLRLGLPAPEYFEGCDAEVVAALAAAADVLRDQGAVIVDVQMPPAELQRAAQLLSPSESHAYHQPDLLATPGNYGPNLGARFRAGGGYFASDYIQAQRVRSLLKEQLRAVLLGCDAILTPTQGAPAATMEDAAAMAQRRFGLSYTSLFNQTGLPSLSIPSGFSSSGLPLSLLISGRPFDEATVLRIGHAYEQATDWHQRHPAL
jgi:aspartyl-tRNA(Asn)/glutamyl-tRNA(Gln) amidotransferase subunit A